MNNLIANTCKICGNITGNIPFRVKEFQFGTFDEFNYFECCICKCIQINKIPKDLHQYYPANYYSYSTHQKKLNKLVEFLTLKIKKNLSKYYAGKFNLIGMCFSLFYKNPFPWLKKNIFDFHARILDVGAGAGRLLLSMQRSGFENLTGIDPFVENDINYKNGVSIYKKDIFNVVGEFDIIMLHHSFEHMDFPYETLEKTRSLLCKNGIIIIRMPVTGGYVWRKYREYWAQIDAPRHFFIHSLQSMQHLCKAAHLQISNIEYDSTIFQFTGSEKYLRSIPLNSEELPFTKKQIRNFRRETNRLNKIHDGDAACFYIRKI